ncbi:hypothetical protein BVC71_00350 [Marivivens niveibacter]|uniref:Histidine kinase/HSP90-like ATPase domain-containing protein n=1 Tax=Marivivens niveibacter TaxID=1930667 RepID=A0A251X0U0_9RHOB|nr:ATP-binding protein [Marivivens niveibacter]OUD10008.1 hypothetical protein BVC71_00350 [Marivivens niveibacter]
MRKLTLRYKNVLLYRSRKAMLAKRRLGRSKRLLVDVWYGGEVEQVYCLEAPQVPPEVLCLDKNTLGSLRFLADWRHRMLTHKDWDTLDDVKWINDAKRPGGMRSIQYYADFSGIKELSTAVALILTAEYDRLGTLVNDVPPTVELDKWPKHLFRQLFEIGFFEILKLSEDVADRYRTSGSKKTMRIIAGSTSEEIEVVSSRIKELYQFIEPEHGLGQELSVALNNALSEAMINVVKHAYPADHKFTYRPINKWWVTASADVDKRELTVVFYDQGVTIPITFPRRKISDRTRDFINKLLTSRGKFDFENDGTYLAGAMQKGSTQTDEEHRGLGLAEMKELIDICGHGSLRVFSRGGEYRYDAGSQIVSRSRRLSIGGTLFEWTLRIPQEQLDEGRNSA